MYEFKPRLLKQQTLTPRRLPLPPPVEVVAHRPATFGDGLFVGVAPSAVVSAVMALVLS